MLCSLGGLATDAARDEMESSSHLNAELDVINDVSICFDKELISSQEVRLVFKELLSSQGIAYPSPSY